MTPDKLLLLIKAWQEDSCPGEILFDALLDYGYDPDQKIAFGIWSTGTIRGHLFGDLSNAPCSSSDDNRKNCELILKIRQKIESEIAAKNAPFTGENTTAASS